MFTQHEDELTADYPVFEPEPEESVVELEQSSTSSNRSELTLKILKQVHESVGHVIELLEGAGDSGSVKHLADLVTSKQELIKHQNETGGMRVLEGIFDGQGMVASDGKVYSVPPNYASKSRLVEGDVLKLTIRPDGTFIYKQIGPVERERIVGCLAFDAGANDYIILCEELTYKVLTASVTYFKGEPGDEVVAFIPKSGKCTWAAVENIIKK